MQRAFDRMLVLKDGRTLSFAEYGEQQGTPILLFHGTPGSRLEGGLFERAAHAYHVRIIVADRPGYATSSPVRRGSLLGYVGDVVALADTLQVDTFSVLGASGGGPFALACAAEIPERVRCCGLMSAIGPLALPHSMDGMIAVNRMMFTLARFLPALPGLLVPRQLTSSMKSLQHYLDEGTSPMADVPPEVFAQLMVDQLEAVRVGGKGITFDFGILTRPWGFPLEQIHSRVWMWHGAEDNLAPLALARYTASHIPGCVLKVIPNAGHAGTYACADEVMKALSSC
jgi:pimeloyl-ACP methyl ester carboxylesterase